MTLSSVKYQFGVHGITLINLTTGKPYNEGALRVLGTATISNSREIIPLPGGSNPYDWTNEPGKATTEASITLREFPDAVYQALAGITPNRTAAEPGAYVDTTARNEIGTTVGDQIASIAVESGNEADVPMGDLIIEAASATTVNLYATNSSDFSRGTPKSFVDDSLLITASPITLTASPASVPGFGIEITATGATPTFVVGDVARISLRPISTGGSRIITFGSSTELLREFGMIIAAQKMSNGALVELECFKCLSPGLGSGFDEFAYSEQEITIKMSVDTTRVNSDGSTGAIYEIRDIPLG